jgi:hypothetical protein
MGRGSTLLQILKLLRLEFKGHGAETRVDEVLFFDRLANASELEQELHTLFDQEKLFSCGAGHSMRGEGRKPRRIYERLGM